MSCDKAVFRTLFDISLGTALIIRLEDRPLRSFCTLVFQVNVKMGQFDEIAAQAPRQSKSRITPLPLSYVVRPTLDRSHVRDVFFLHKLRYVILSHARHQQQQHLIEFSTSLLTMMMANNMVPTFHSLYLRHV